MPHNLPNINEKCFKSSYTHQDLKVKKTRRLKQQDNLVHSSPDSLLAKINNKVSLLALGSLVRVINTSEALDLALASGGVDAALVGLLAVLERGGDVDEEEVAELLDDLAGGVTAGLEGRDGSGDDGGAGLGELGGDEADAVDVLLAVLAGEAQLGGELGADGLAEEERDAAATLLVEGNVQGAGDGVLAGVGVAGEEDGETLLVAGRVRLAEDLDDLRVGEPFGMSAPVRRRLRSSVPEMLSWRVVLGTSSTGLYSSVSGR
jgi:hypothetical protein